MTTEPTKDEKIAILEGEILSCNKSLYLLRAQYKVNQILENIETMERIETGMTNLQVAIGEFQSMIDTLNAET